MTKVTVETTFSNLASRMMGKFGADAVLTRVTETYDPVLDETVRSMVTSSILVVLEDRDVENRDGMLSKETVIKSNTQLAPNDRITLLGRTYRVETVTETAPTGKAFFWTAVVC
jgi:hypothetical protein